MSSHYLSCFVSAPFTAVFGALEKRFGNTYAKRFSPTGVHEVGVILGEQYFFRVNSDVAITILLEALDTEKTKIEGKFFCSRDLCDLHLFRNVQET